MEHLPETRMIAAIWDGIESTPGERDHLNLCEECQRQYTVLAKLHDEFEVARRSQISPEAESRYLEILTEARQSIGQGILARSVVGSLSEWITALPIWDSRQQTLAIGVRSGKPSSYRMVFGTGTTEVELMVENHQGYLRLIGEILGEVESDETEEVSGLALVELMASENAKVALETVSDDSGRFLIEQVPPGFYVMTITPRHSPVIVIKPLELT